MARFCRAVLDRVRQDIEAGGPDKDHAVAWVQALAPSAPVPFDADWWAGRRTWPNAICWGAAGDKGPSRNVWQEVLPCVQG